MSSKPTRRCTSHRDGWTLRYTAPLTSRSIYCAHSTTVSSTLKRRRRLFIGYMSGAHRFKFPMLVPLHHPKPHLPLPAKGAEWSSRCWSPPPSHTLRNEIPSTPSKSILPNPLVPCPSVEAAASTGQTRSKAGPLPQPIPELKESALVGDGIGSDVSSRVSAPSPPPMPPL